jgi:uncharacterized protein with PIN domain
VATATAVHQRGTRYIYAEVKTLKEARRMFDELLRCAPCNPVIWERSRRGDWSRVQSAVGEGCSDD